MELRRSVRAFLTIGPSTLRVERKRNETLRSKLGSVGRIQRVVSEFVRIRLGAY